MFILLPRLYAKRSAEYADLSRLIIKLFTSTQDVDVALLVAANENPDARYDKD